MATWTCSGLCSASSRSSAAARLVVGGDGGGVNCGGGARRLELAAGTTSCCGDTLTDHDSVGGQKVTEGEAVPGRRHARGPGRVDAAYVRKGTSAGPPGARRTVGRHAQGRWMKSGRCGTRDNCKRGTGRSTRRVVGARFRNSLPQRPRLTLLCARFGFRRVSPKHARGTHPSSHAT